MLLDTIKLITNPDGIFVDNCQLWHNTQNLLVLQVVPVYKENSLCELSFHTWVRQEERTSSVFPYP